MLCHLVKNRFAHGFEGKEYMYFKTFKFGGYFYLALLVVLKTKLAKI